MKNRILLLGLVLLNTLVLHAQPSSWRVANQIEAAIDSIEPSMPIVKRLFPYHIRDVSVCRGANHKYYLTGTTGDTWGVSKGIRVWESDDLKDWHLIGKDGFVWTFDQDATNNDQKGIKNARGRKMRAVWAPEIHYLKGNYWIPYSISAGYGSGLLRSTTGKPEGPYVDISPDHKLVSGIDATLFEDTDGEVYYIWGGGNVKRMKSNMLGFVDKKPPLKLLDAEGKSVGYEGVNMYYKNGAYYLMAAEWNGEGPQRGHLMRTTNENRRSADGRYDCMVAMSKHLLGPYSKSYIALPHGGHNMIFDDFDGNTWASLFGNDAAAAPFREQPGLVPMMFDQDKIIRPNIPYPFKSTSQMPVIYVSKDGDNTDGKSWETAYNSVQIAIDKANSGTAIWIKGGTYNGGIKISEKEGIYIYGGFLGREKGLEERPRQTKPTVLDGNNIVSHVVQINHSSSVRLDGLTITGGNASNWDENNCGAGILLDGGGESIHLANCMITKNKVIKDGAGMWASNGASPLFVNCTFSENRANENGGAIYVDCNRDNGYHSRFYNCEFKNNSALANGGVAWFRTDLKQTGTLRFVNCLITGNYTQLEGGNIMMNGGAVLYMNQCTVTKNRGVMSGAAIGTLGNVPAQNIIVNTIFTNNYGVTLFFSQAYQGTDKITGAAQNWTIVSHCLFHQNETIGLFGFVQNQDRFNSVEQINEQSWGDGNISAAPNFVDPQTGGFKLKLSSAALKKGTAAFMFPYDIDGQKRNLNQNSLGASCDIGYDELDHN